MKPVDGIAKEALLSTSAVNDDCAGSLQQACFYVFSSALEDLRSKSINFTKKLKKFVSRIKYFAHIIRIEGKLRDKNTVLSAERWPTFAATGEIAKYSFALEPHIHSIAIVKDAFPLNQVVEASTPNPFMPLS